jgi:hypothetical protein
MGKKKKLYVDFNEFLLHETLDHCMFCYVIGLQSGLPSVKLHHAILSFMDAFNLSEDNYPLDQAKQVWYRMHPKYVKLRSELDN